MSHEGPLIQHDADLWSSEYGLRWLAGLVPLPARTTVIRLADRQLIVHSPGPISAELRRALDALGTVGFLVIPQAHGRFAAAAAQAYPSARLLAAPDPPSSGRSLGFHGALADAPPAAWSDEVESHLVLGFRLHEVVLFHRPSRTLVLTDLCFNVHHSPSRTARWVFRADGMWRRFGPSRATRLLVSDRAAFRRSLEHVLRWDFERIVPGHGEIVEKDGRAALRAAWLGA